MLTMFSVNHVIPYEHSNHDHASDEYTMCSNAGEVTLLWQNSRNNKFLKKNCVLCVICHYVITLGGGVVKDLKVAIYLV